MKIKNTILSAALGFITFSSSLLIAQGQTWRWNFGNNASINFAGGGAPVATPGSAMTTAEGCASIATPAGALAFYTDGNKVWNANNVQMANGFGLFGNSSTTQAAIIVPRPGNPNLYYIFACSSNFSPGNISYSEVNMTLNGGLGDVTAVKNVVIQTNVAEKLTAVRHCNGVDVWVIAHDYTNSNYYVFLVTAAGVSTTPVVSSVGAPCSGNVVGAIKTSPNGRKIAYVASNGPFALHVADFNNSTGVISNAIDLATTPNVTPAYGLEFSPNGQILYASKWASTNQIIQWDLCGNAAAVLASGIVVGTGANTHGQMQLGPDGKIYVARGGATFLGVINNPNTLGTGCNYVANGVSTAPGTCQYGLPTFIQSYFIPPMGPITAAMSCLTGTFSPPTGFSSTTSCAAVVSNSITGYLWNFGDPASGSANTSTLSNPIHVFSGPGNFTVTLTSSLQCGTGTSSIVVTAISCSPQVSVNSPSICSGNCAVITATSSGGNPPYTYVWSPNIGTSAGPFTVCPNSTTVYSVTITDAMGVTATNTSVVFVTPTPTLNLTPNSSSLCMNNYNGSINSVNITASGATTYSWSGASGITISATSGAAITATAIPASLLGSVTVTGLNGTCSNTAVFTVTNIPNPIISVPSASVCSGASVVLTASGASSYVWSPSSSLNSSTGNTVISSPNITTVYSIIGTSLNCKSQTQTATVTTPATPLVLTITANTLQVCTGSNINLSVSGAGGFGAPYSFVWSSGATSSNISSAQANSGIYTYSVTGTDAQNCTASAVQTVTFIQSPVISSSGASICNGQKANLYVNGASNYTWSPNTGLNTNYGASVISSPNVTTVYSILGANAFCSAATTVTVEVIQYPSLGLTSPNQEICFGKSTQIIAAPAQHYSWSPNYNISSTTSGSVTVSPAQSTTYTVNYYNGTGTLVCAVTQFMPIIVLPEIKPVISENKTICEGEKVQLSAGGGSSYIWLPSGSLNNATLATVDANPTSTTIYTLEVSYNGSCAQTTVVSVNVNPNPKVYAGRDSVYNADEPININAIGTGTLTWIYGDGIFCRDCPNTVVKPNASSCYIVEAVNQFGCKAKDDVCIDLTYNSGVYIPSSFTPNGDGLNDVFMVMGYSVSDIKLEIFDRWGEKLFTTGEIGKGWDGMYKGQLCKSDVYPYKVTYKSLDGKINYKLGHVTLLK